MRRGVAWHGTSQTKSVRRGGHSTSADELSRVVAFVSPLPPLCRRVQKWAATLAIVTDRVRTQRAQNEGTTAAAIEP